jgi:large subunit ribosomal protein L16
MFQPPVRSYRKDRKRRKFGTFKSGVTQASIVYGVFAIQAMEPGACTARQIEAARRVIMREVKRRCRLWIRIFPDKPISKKPLEVRQGKGKGSVEHYVAVIRTGAILFEIPEIEEEIAYHALRQACYKLPFRCRLLRKGSVHKKFVLEEAAG